MDWNDCLDVEAKPEVMHGTPVVVGTRVPADSILEHAWDGHTPEQIATDIFPSVPVARVRRILSYASLHAPRAA